MWDEERVFWGVPEGTRAAGVGRLCEHGAGCPWAKASLYILQLDQEAGKKSKEVSGGEDLAAENKRLSRKLKRAELERDI